MLMPFALQHGCLAYKVHLRFVFHVDALCTTTRMPCLEVHLRSMFYVGVLLPSSFFVK